MRFSEPGEDQGPSRVPKEKSGGCEAVRDRCAGDYFAKCRKIVSRITL